MKKGPLSQDNSEQTKSNNKEVIDEEDPKPAEEGTTEKKLTGFWWRTPQYLTCIIEGCNKQALRDGTEIHRCSFEITNCGRT